MSGTTTTWGGRLRRATCALLLLLVCSDVVYPGVCCDESGGRDLVESAALYSGNAAASTRADAAEGRTTPDPDRPGEAPACDDCFCCARVTTATAVTAIASPDHEAATPARAGTRLSAAHPRPTYHPPRLA